MTPDPFQPARTGAQPPSPDQLERGYRLLREQRFQDALAHADALADRHPADPATLVLAAEARYANADLEGALARTDQAIAASGGDPVLKVRKARLLSQLRRRAEIPALADEIAAQAAGHGALLWEVGGLYHRNYMQPQAIAHFEQARALLGDHPGLLYDLATARFFSGDFEQAERDLDRMLELAPEAGPAWYLRATLRRQAGDRNHVSELEHCLAAGFRNPDDAAAAYYALGKELEDLGEHARAFDALAAGAARRRGTLRYDVAAEVASMQAIQQAYTAEAMASATPGHPEAGAIFVVGMPRSGTTLVERMLTQSNRVVSAGELLDFGTLLGSATQAVMDANPNQTQARASLQVDFAALGHEYMRGGREAARGSTRFIDKMPINFLYCGMIRKALPNARIVHLVRDPLDTCYAVFKTLFYNSYSFSYDLSELADYYIAYRRMMAHWHAVMPGAILDVRYEDLVRDPEGQGARLYAWCGLEWDPALLQAPTDSKVFATASAAQVREPVHTRSVGSSRRHAARMAPLVDKLVAEGLMEP
jgi:tetratricopeptide (TPR) repeat protein